MLQPTLHLLVGLPGSGKTTLAKRISMEGKTIRLTPDEWQLRLFGDDTDHPEHDRRHSEVEAIMWELAVELLKAGISVILDFGFWAIEERQFFYKQAKHLSVFFRVHFLDVPREELLHRVSARNESATQSAFTILPSHMAKWMDIFQPVTPEELSQYADLLPPG